MNNINRFVKSGFSSYFKHQVRKSHPQLERFVPRTEQASSQQKWKSSTTFSPNPPASSFFNIQQLFWSGLALTGLGFIFQAYQNVAAVEEDGGVSINPHIPDWTFSAQKKVNITWKEQPESDPTFAFVEESCHIDSHTYFYRGVIYIKDPKKDLDDLNSPYFDPLFEKCTIHALKVITKNGTEDKLHTTTFTKEGDFSLDNLQEGDMVEFSFSVQGGSPQPSGLFNTIKEPEDACEKYVGRIVGDAQRVLRTKAHNTTSVVTQESMRSGLKVYTWELSNTQDPDEEKSPRLEVSEYKNWNQVVQEQLPLYTLPRNFKPSEEMEKLVQKWKDESNGDLYTAANLALEFVQDEITYGWHEGNKWEYTPFPPEGTLESKIGNCRDKSLLLHTFLGMMGIDSQIALTDSDASPELAESLPGPHVFDHTILRIAIEGKHYWVEPINRQQGGDLKTKSFPGFGHSLVLDRATQDLVPCPSNKLTGTFIETAIKADTAAQKVFLTYSTHLSGTYADAMRKDIYFAKQYKAPFQSNYLPSPRDGKYILENAHPVEISDDRKKNIVVLKQQFDLLPIEEGNERVVELTPAHLMRTLRGDEHSYQGSLKLPSGGAKEEMTVKGMTSPEIRNMQLSNDFMRYQIATTQEEKRTKYSMETEYLTDFVPAKNHMDYIKMLGQIKTSAPRVRFSFTGRV